MIDVVDFEFCKEEEIMWSMAMVFNIHQMIAIECRQVVFLFCIVWYTILCLPQWMNARYQLSAHKKHNGYMQLQKKRSKHQVALIAVTDHIPVCAGAAISRQRGKQEQMFAQ